MDSALVNSFEGFLKWGSTGLAGLMLVLVIFAIIGRDVSDTKKSLLKTFMVVGATCFVVSLAAEVYLQSIANTGRHKVVLAVLPNDLDGSSFPPPEVKLDGSPIDRNTDLYIDRSAALSVDVSSALGLFRRTSAMAEQAQAEAERTRVTLAAVSEEAEQVKRRADEATEMVANLKHENSKTTSALREAESALQRQDNILRFVAARSEDLARRVKSLSVSNRQSLRAPALRSAPSAQIRQLERDIEQINRALGGAIR